MGDTELIGECMWCETRVKYNALWNRYMDANADWHCEKAQNAEMGEGAQYHELA